MAVLPRQDRSIGIRIFPGILFALGVLAVFALNGPYPPAVWLALPVLGLAGLAITLRIPVWAGLAFLPLLILVPATGFIRWFDIVPLSLAALAIVAAAQDGRREVWNIGAGGVLGIAILLVPLLGLPQVVNLPSWAGGYKNLVMAAITFFSLIRVVPRERSNTLLYAFPLAGTVIAYQLLTRTAVIGGLLTARPQFRAFYTSLGWGSSNYLGAILVLCIGCSIVLWMLERRIFMKLLIALSLLIQLQAFIELQSRGATLALVVLGLFLVLGGGRVYGLTVGVIAVLMFALGLGTPPGQVLVRRFLEPQESASWFARVDIWAQTWARFIRYPWTGIGLNQGRYTGDEMGISDSHDFVLQALMEQGILGGIVTIALIIGVIRMAARARPRDADGMRGGRVRRAILGVTVAVFAHSMIEPTFNGFEMLMLFTWFLGWLALQSDRIDDGPVSASSPQVRAISR